MRTARVLVSPLLPWLMLLGSCSSPPKPPMPDESRKRPANIAMAVQLQTCAHELHNARIVASEAQRAAASALSAPPVQLGQADEVAPQANGIYTVRFDFGSARVTLPPETAAAMVQEARQAPLVLLRGRTDGSTDTLGESRVARGRAEAVRDYLVAAGVDPARIRATHQPTGDHVADNGTSSGRGENRRVEVEVYRALPVAMTPFVVAHQ